MKVVYEPKGRAKEYAPLACNIYLGCEHACKYCFAPSCMRKKPEEYHKEVKTRSKTFLADFQDDCDKLRLKGDDRRILFSFLSDPYQPIEAEMCLTQSALMVALGLGAKIDILTKGKYDLVSRDFHLMKQGKVRLGVSLCFINDESRKEWEPNASSVEDRIKILEEAHKRGIETWISIEPVIYPEEALEVIKRLKGSVDLWKVGKLNHHKEIEKNVDWHKFLCDAVSLLWDESRVIKRDLWIAAAEGKPIETPIEAKRDFYPMPVSNLRKG